MRRGTDGSSVTDETAKGPAAPMANASDLITTATQPPFRVENHRKRSLESILAKVKVILIMKVLSSYT